MTNYKITIKQDQKEGAGIQIIYVLLICLFGWLSVEGIFHSSDVDALAGPILFIMMIGYMAAISLTIYFIYLFVVIVGKSDKIDEEGFVIIKTRFFSPGKIRKIEEEKQIPQTKQSFKYKTLFELKK